MVYGILVSQPSSTSLICKRAEPMGPRYSWCRLTTSYFYLTKSLAKPPLYHFSYKSMTLLTNQYAVLESTAKSTLTANVEHFIFIDDKVCAQFEHRNIQIIINM
jgi:hypothetical protein